LDVWSDFGQKEDGNGEERAEDEREAEVLHFGLSDLLLRAHIIHIHRRRTAHLQ
jgi:hypothetical protein